MSCDLTSEISLEGLFEINDHKAAFHSLLNPSCYNRWQFCLEMLSACALLPISSEQHHPKSVTDNAQDAGAASQSRGKEFNTCIRWGKQWSEVQAEQSRRQTYGRQDRKSCCVLASADLCQQLSWHPHLWSQTWTSVWEVGLTTVGGRTQKSGMNVKGNIKFILREKTIPTK